MAFPATPLPVVVEIAPGADLSTDPTTWPWVDVSTLVRIQDGIILSEGRSDWGQHVDAGWCSLTFDNTTGDFSEHNPLGQWYGLLGRDTPLRLSLDQPSGRVEVFGGLVPAWVPAWDLSAEDRTVSVTARGTLYRLQPAASRPEARSPLRRTIVANSPAAYWPCEDGQGATAVGSALAGHPPLAFAGSPAFTDVDSLFLPGANVRPGTPSMVDISAGSSLSVALPAGVTIATGSAWSVFEIDYLDPSTVGASYYVMAEVATPGGTFARWQFRRSVGDTQIVAITADGTETIVAALGNGRSGLGERDFGAYQDGASIVAGMFTDSGGTWLATGSVAGTLAGITEITINPDRNVSSDVALVGQVAVFASQHPPAVLGSGYQDDYGEFVQEPLLSYLNEAAHVRLARLCDEDGVPLTVSDTVAAEDAATSRMSWQSTAAPLALYRECEAVDGGVLYERPFGLQYTPRTALYSQDAALVLDYEAGDLGAAPQPPASGQHYRNRWRVDALDGSSVVVESDDAATGVVYPDFAALNLYDEQRLAGHAAWRLHLTTNRDLRWPRLELNLASRPSHIDAWLACRVGSRIRVSNMPADVAAQGIDVLLEGWTVTLGPFEFRVEANCSPASPWQVGTAGGAARVAAGGSTLDADLADGAMSMSLASPDELWTTDPVDFPLDVRVGGERVTLSAIAGTVSPQTATISSRAVNGITRAWPAGTEVTAWEPIITAL